MLVPEFALRYRPPAGGAQGSGDKPVETAAIVVRKPG
jgi:hypothetical protein